MSENPDNSPESLRLAINVLQGKMERLEAGADKVASAANELIYKDPHQWSTRPCQTCRTITTLVGYPFGCYRYAAEKVQREVKQ